MSNLRLLSANTPSAKRTIKTFKPVQLVSMSSAAKEYTSNNSNAAKANKRHEQRVTEFNKED